MNIPYFEAPLFKDAKAASDFDKRVFVSHPKYQHFLRRTSPMELKGRQVSLFSNNKGQQYSLVVQVFPGFRLTALLSAPCVQSPAEFRAALEKDPAIAELIRNLQGGIRGKN